MISIQQYIKCYENVISEDLCKKIINQNNLNEFLPAKIDSGKINKHRNCLIKKLDDKFEKQIFKVIGNILNKYHKEFSHFIAGIKTKDTGYDHLLYLGSEKGEYKEHVDHMDINPRVLSCSLILNDNYTGGDFSFFKGEYIVKKKKGSAVVFPSNFCFPHAILPVSNGNRHSIITWIC